MPSWMGSWIGAGSTADTTPTAAPTIALSTATTTAVTLTHTAPVAADYSTTVVEYGEVGAAASGSVSGSGATIQVTGLTQGKRYWFVAYAKDTSDNYSDPSAVVLASTLFGTGQEDLAVELVAEGLSNMASPPDQTYRGLRWPHNWDGTFSALIRLRSTALVDGHGGIEQRRYEIDCILRCRVRDPYGNTQQDRIAAYAYAARNALHLKDPSTFGNKPSGLWQVEVPDPIDISGETTEPDVDYVETTIRVVLKTFETVP